MKSNNPIQSTIFYTYSINNYLTRHHDGIKIAGTAVLTIAAIATTILALLFTPGLTPFLCAPILCASVMGCIGLISASFFISSIIQYRKHMRQLSRNSTPEDPAREINPPINLPTQQDEEQKATPLNQSATPIIQENASTPQVAEAISHPSDQSATPVIQENAPAPQVPEAASTFSDQGATPVIHENASTSQVAEAISHPSDQSATPVIQENAPTPQVAESTSRPSDPNATQLIHAKRTFSGFKSVLTLLPIFFIATIIYMIYNLMVPNSLRRSVVGFLSRKTTPPKSKPAPLTPITQPDKVPLSTSNPIPVNAPIDIAPASLPDAPVNSATSSPPNSDSILQMMHINKENLNQVNWTRDIINRIIHNETPPAVVSTEGTEYEMNIVEIDKESLSYPINKNGVALVTFMGYEAQQKLQELLPPMSLLARIIVNGLIAPNCQSFTIFADGAFKIEYEKEQTKPGVCIHNAFIENKIKECSSLKSLALKGLGIDVNKYHKNISISCGKTISGTVDFDTGNLKFTDDSIFHSYGSFRAALTGFHLIENEIFTEIKGKFPIVGDQTIDPIRWTIAEFTNTFGGSGTV